MRTSSIAVLILLLALHCSGAVHKNASDGGWLDCGRGSSLNFTNSITIVATVYNTTDPGVSAMFIFGKGFGSASRQFNFGNALWASTSQKRLSFDYYATDATEQTAHTTNYLMFATNKIWHSVGCAFTYSNGASMKFFEKGNRLLVEWISGTGNKNTTTTTTNFTIGKQPTGGGDWVGSISEVAIWNVVLTDRELENLTRSKVKRMPLQIRPSNLVAYWPLDEGKQEALSGTNMFKNLASTGKENFGSPISTIRGRPESWFSYPPNE